MRHAPSVQRGFTFIELMMTLAIMGVLVMVAVMFCELCLDRVFV
jgi:prepilin-type N-terminal cleavage/methylation domain-containing protein